MPLFEMQEGQTKQQQQEEEDRAQGCAHELVRIRERPKSPSFTRQALSTRMLALFRSRWRIGGLRE